MSAKTSSSPVSRLKGLALNRSVGGLVRPKLRRVHTANSEKELLKAVDGGTFAGMDDFSLRQTPLFQDEVHGGSMTVLSCKLRAGTRQEEYVCKASASTNEAETADKQASVNKKTPSYQLDFKDSKSRVVNVNSRIRELVNQVLFAHLDTWEYNHDICGEKCRTISQAIENGVKSMYSARHKIIALVYIGAIRDRGIELSSQCVWNPSTDSFVMATFANDSLFASGIVFATLFSDE